MTNPNPNPTTPPGPESLPTYLPEGDADSPLDPSFFRALFDVSFTKYITPSVVKVVYVLAIALVAVFAVVSTITGFTQGAMPGLLALGFAVIGGTFSLVFFRMTLEFYLATIRTSQTLLQMQRRGLQP